MSKVDLTIDGQQISAAEGEKLLWVALDNGIFIPHLCAVKERETPTASCRLCFVEIEGFEQPVTACTQEVKEGMVVQTRTPWVDRLVQSAFELLLSDHRLDCKNCAANKSCALQEIAKKRDLKLKLSRFNLLERESSIDDSPGNFFFDPSRCVLCGKCVYVDREVAKAGILGFSRRGLNRCITTFNDQKLANFSCDNCGLCVETCPVGALCFK